MEGIKSIVLKHLKAIQSEMVNNMSARGRNASGQSVASLSIDIHDGQPLTGAIIGSESWRYMQHGRGPGKVPADFRDTIKKWILNKGINYKNVGSPKASAETKINSLSYLIARSIREKGTRLFQKQGYNDIYDSVVDSETDAMADALSSRFEMEVNETSI